MTAETPLDQGALEAALKSVDGYVNARFMQRDARVVRAYLAPEAGKKLRMADGALTIIAMHLAEKHGDLRWNGDVPGEVDSIRFEDDKELLAFARALLEAADKAEGL